MESTTTNNAIKEGRELFNEIRGSLSREEINRIRKEKDDLTDKEKIVLKNIGKYLKNFEKYLEKLQKYQGNITYGIDYLFNEEDYCKPTEVKSAFDGNYVLYERRGDKDANLALYQYFEKIKPHLKDMIDD